MELMAGEPEPQAGDEGPCSCGQPGWWSLDPYRLEMGGTDSWEFFCDDCHGDACANI